MNKKLQQNDRFILDKLYWPQMSSQPYDNLVGDKY